MALPECGCSPAAETSSDCSNPIEKTYSYKKSKRFHRPYTFRITQSSIVHYCRRLGQIMRLQENAAAKYKLLEGSANNNPLIITPLDLSSLNDTQPCHSHSHSDGNESSGISSYSQNEKSDDSENIEVAIPNESSSTRHPLVSPRSYSGKREIFIESPRSLRTPGKDGLGKYLNSAGTSMIAKLLDNNNLPYASQSDSETESTVDANGDFHGVWARENVTVANYSAASAQDIAPVHKPHPEPSSYQLAVNTSQPQQQPWVNGRTPPGGKATPTTANHSVAASKAQTTDFDSSSGTSDGSINISKATKGIEETLRLDGKVLNNLLDEQYRPSPKKASSPTKKPPRQPLINYPRFYYPQGQPVSSVVNDSALRRVCEVFKAFPNQQCEIDDMFEVCQAAGLPLYWKAPIFAALTKNEPRPATLMDFTVWWRAMTSVAHDEASRFVYTLTGGTRSHLLPVDFHSLVMNIIHTHPGLGFYREAVEFHDKYRDVVVTRIFWNVARNWSGKITTEEIRKSDLLQAIRELQLDDDINKSLRYFSYEHFYVVYCKFFDLDTDHDMKIDRDDLATHSDGAIVPLVIERIFSGAVCRIARRKSNVEQIGLVEFTQFLLAEEDKAHRTSIEYWFRILDQDGDGIVTLYDMEKFHEQIQKKLAERNIDSMAFKDVACQLIDMIGSGCTSSFRLKDLKASKLRARFINSFVNWHKFYTQETNEGSESARIEDESGQELSEWDRYCMEEYEQILEHDEAETISVNLDDEDRPTMTFHDLL